MDSPTLDRIRHLAALDALARVSVISLTARRVWSEVARLADRGVAPVRVLDLACGGGDVLRRVAGRARRAGKSVELVGCDRSPVALERARAECASAAGVTFQQVDVLRDPIPSGHDIVCSSLFLHHLDGDAAAHFLAGMAGAAQRVVLVQDLLRTRLGYVYAWVGLGLMTQSDVARHDGPVSVAAAFSLSEARALCRDSGLHRAEVVRSWPQRFTLRWERA
jgi:SAM-dependent methyltransferase